MRLRSVGTARGILALISVGVTLTGCASNAMLSDAIVFSDRFNEEVAHPRFALLRHVSANLAPRATAYGNDQLPSDSLRDVMYQNVNLGAGLAAGVLSKRLAGGVSIQPFMIGADLSAAPWERTCCTVMATTSASYAASCLVRYNRSIAVGPFYRKDRFQGARIAEFFSYVPTAKRERHVFAESFGLTCHIRNEEYDGSERIYTVELGVSPEMESVFLSVGFNIIKIY